MGIADADSAEENPSSQNCVITPLSCALPNRREGAPKGSGDEPVKIAPGTLLHKICGSEDHSEQYFCNYGVNLGFERRFVAAGVKISARGGQGEIRAIEIPDHRFFLATLFQPQLSSRPELPHPVWIAFLRAAAMFRGRQVDELPIQRATGKKAASN